MGKASNSMFSDLPSDPVKRMRLLAKFLSQWGWKLTPGNVAKLRAAKKRLGAIPRCLEVYYELGIDRWLQKRSAKFSALWGENWYWTSPDELKLDPKQELIIFGSAGPKCILYGIRERLMSEPDPMVMTHVGGSDWPFANLSEILIRECILQTTGTRPASKLHLEKGLQSGQHPLELKAGSLLSRIPVVEERSGLVELYEGQSVLLLRRFPPRCTEPDLYIAGKSAADKKTFLNIDAGEATKSAKAQPKASEPNRAKTSVRPTNVSTLRNNLKKELKQSVYAPAAQFICEAAVPCVRFFDCGEYQRPKIGASRIGGDPDLPAGFEWPLDPNAPTDKAALAFIGQINFKELPSWSRSVFPKSGLLSLFIGMDGFQGTACGFYFSSRKKLLRTKTPVDQLVRDFGQPLRPMKISSALSLSIPAFVSGFQQRVSELCKRQADFDRDYLAEDLRDFDQIGSEGSFGKLGGYAATPVQRDYHERAACRQLKINGFVGARNSFDVTAIKSTRTRNRIYEKALQQQLLFSIDSGNSTGAMWSDAGILYLVHDQEQIAARNFDTFPTFIYH